MATTYFALRACMTVPSIGPRDGFHTAEIAGNSMFSDCLAVLDTYDLVRLRKRIDDALSGAPRVLAFNTMRQYSPYGQRIAASRLSDGRLVFVDADRCVYGVTKAPCSLLPHVVMDEYDHGRYTPAAWGHGELTDDLRSLLCAHADCAPTVCAEPVEA